MITGKTWQSLSFLMMYIFMASLSKVRKPGVYPFESLRVVVQHANDARDREEYASIKRPASENILLHATKCAKAFVQNLARSMTNTQ